jgi:hypothetical protein
MSQAKQDILDLRTSNLEPRDRNLQRGLEVVVRGSSSRWLR